jgi:excisionase family DNA binding protein
MKARTPARSIDDLPLVLPIPLLAEVLHVSRSMAYGLVRSGRIRSLDLGRRRLVPRSALAEFIGENGGPA